MVTVLVFLKAPIEGLVKTRLANRVGTAKALAAYRTLGAKQMQRLPDHPVEIHFTPAAEVEVVRAWLGDAHKCYAQSEGDLGKKLSDAVFSAYGRWSSPIICIGGDCPALGPEQIAEAAQALANDKDLVLGPTEDGGYYLIGLKRPCPELLKEIPWSSQETLSATSKRAESLGMCIHLLEKLYDVDEFAQLERAVSEGLLPKNLL